MQIVNVPNHPRNSDGFVDLYVVAKSPSQPYLTKLTHYPPRQFALAETFYVF